MVTQECIRHGSCLQEAHSLMHEKGTCTGDKSFINGIISPRTVSVLDLQPKLWRMGNIGEEEDMGSRKNLRIAG